jgi:membrane protein implicated in regulation of membrane protease activity
MKEDRILVNLKIAIGCVCTAIVCITLLLLERTVSQAEYDRLSQRVEQLEQMHGYTVDSTTHDRGHDE